MTDPMDPIVDFSNDIFSVLPLDLDHTFFSHGDDQNDVVPLEDLDFDFSFDHLEIPFPEDLTDPNHTQADQFRGVFEWSSPELRHVNESCNFSLDASGATVSNADSSQVLGYLNVESPELTVENFGAGVKGLNCPSPGTQGSENFWSNVSEESHNSAVSSSNNNCSVDQKVKFEFINSNHNVNHCNNYNHHDKSVLKRKKEGNDLMMSSSSIKYSKSNSGDKDTNCVLSEEEEKKRARLMRNRESAQLSRERKKHYVEDLEDKVKRMNSTIQDLTAKISYFMTENTTLRKQLTSGGGNGGVVPPPMVPSPPPGMYSYPMAMYPWKAYPPPYLMKPQGSQVPLVPIPRLKPQKPAQGLKASKKAENKKNDAPETKKVAGVSFLGLLFFFMLIVGLVPMVNQKYGGFREVLTGKDSCGRGGFYGNNHGNVLMTNGTEYGYGERYGGIGDNSGDGGGVHCGQRGHCMGKEPSADESVRLGNKSEPLVVSLYVPRNDKLVKIDGNLIIHSVLASDKAMASREETSLAVRGGLAPAVPVNGVGQPHLKALGPGSAYEESMPTINDRKLQQWFREGLAGPMLSSGMCSEVFQFDVSTPSSLGAIVPASKNPRNISHKHSNQTRLSQTRNRRILGGVPEATRNVSTESSGKKDDSNRNNNSSSPSMVVSVLFDPRETDDSHIEGARGRNSKSLSRIFIVVLIDSVKYVTYSCMLPFKASATLGTT